MIWIGTSGFQYPEWRGTFYPAKMSPARMLGFYSEQFPTTEINYTFRRIPSEKTIARWVAETPEAFRFTLKVPEKITHHARLRDCDSTFRIFHDVALKLGAKRGALLFQLPAQFKCDLEVLNEFLTKLPPGLPAAFEFRHDSWFADSALEILQRYDALLCIADTEKLTTPTVFTSSTSAYFRLRRPDYKEADLRRWAKIIEEQRGRLKDIYVYFKHEEAGTGPRFAKELMKLLGLKSAKVDPSEQELPLQT